MGIIDINNIDLTIGKTNILKNITVSFDEGKIHGLIGRNGSGKTMLMKCICGFIKGNACWTLTTETCVMS